MALHVGFQMITDTFSTEVDQNLELRYAIRHLPRYRDTILAADTEKLHTSHLRMAIYLVAQKIILHFLEEI